MSRKELIHNAIKQKDASIIGGLGHLVAGMAGGHVGQNIITRSILKNKTLGVMGMYKQNFHAGMNSTNLAPRYQIGKGLAAAASPELGLISDHLKRMGQTFKQGLDKGGIKYEDLQPHHHEFLQDLAKGDLTTAHNKMHNTMDDYEPLLHAFGHMIKHKNKWAYATVKVGDVVVGHSGHTLGQLQKTYTNKTSLPEILSHVISPMNEQEHALHQKGVNTKSRYLDKITEVGANLALGAVDPGIPIWNGIKRFIGSKTIAEKFPTFSQKIQEPIYNKMVKEPLAKTFRSGLEGKPEKGPVYKFINKNLVNPVYAEIEESAYDVGKTIRQNPEVVAKSHMQNLKNKTIGKLKNMGKDQTDRSLDILYSK